MKGLAQKVWISIVSNVLRPIIVTLSPDCIGTQNDILGKALYEGRGRHVGLPAVSGISSSAHTQVRPYGYGKNKSALYQPGTLLDPSKGVCYSANGRQPGSPGGRRFGLSFKDAISRGGGKSGLHRTGCWVTPRLRDQLRKHVGLRGRKVAQKHTVPILSG